MNENNVLIGQDTYTIEPSTTTVASSQIDKDYDPSLSFLSHPFNWRQIFNWDAAPMHTTYALNWKGVDELKIEFEDEEIKIPVTEDFIKNLKEFFIGLTLSKE